MKLRRVMVVEPIRFRIAPKFGRDNAIRRRNRIDNVRNKTRLGPKARKYKK